MAFCIKVKRKKKRMIFVNKVTQQHVTYIWGERGEE